MEKTRYAKWRAAEISKALREGRQPTPAPASGETAETAIDSVSAPPEPFAGLIDAPSVHFSHELEEPHSTSALPPVSTAFGEEDTPLEIPPASAPAPINASDVQAQHTVLNVSPSPPSSASMLLPHQVDARAPTEAPLPSIAPYDSPADMLQEQGQEYLTSIDAASSPTLAQRPSSPTHLVPQNSPPTAPYLAGGPYASAPPLPPPPSAPYMQIPRQPLPPPPPPPPPPETSPLPELTPGLIAKTQKHCRFAISALDYEDAEQARKELRAALAILGG